MSNLTLAQYGSFLVGIAIQRKEKNRDMLLITRAANVDADAFQSILESFN